MIAVGARSWSLGASPCAIVLEQNQEEFGPTSSENPLALEQPHVTVHLLLARLLFLHTHTHAYMPRLSRRKFFSHQRLEKKNFTEIVIFFSLSFSLHVALSRPLDELLGAAGADFQQPPSGFRIELGRVAAQYPDVVNPHDFFRVALDDVALGVAHAHYLLGGETDGQHGALVHHLAHQQVHVVDVWKKGNRL